MAQPFGSQSLFDLIDQAREIIGSEALSPLFMDLSKNDFFALLFVYREREATMSRIAEHLGVPANTVTGVVGRLQRRGLVDREHSKTDKRVVTITVTDVGVELVSSIIRQLSRYEAAILAELTDEEVRVLLGIATKTVAVLKTQVDADARRPAPVRRIPIE